jgi:hypothetical protein
LRIAVGLSWAVPGNPFRIPDAKVRVLQFQLGCQIQGMTHQRRWPCRWPVTSTGPSASPLDEVMRRLRAENLRCAEEHAAFDRHSMQMNAPGDQHSKVRSHYPLSSLPSRLDVSWV